MKNDDKQPSNGADAFDVVVIGGGPAGYPAAIRAAQNKLSVACIDEWKNRDGSAAFGGTCLNAGCIPSKALLESTELYHRVHEEFAVHGIKVAGATLDLAQMQKRKGGIVRGMTQGILALFKAAGVTPLQGHGRLPAANFPPDTWCSLRGPPRSSCARRRSRPRTSWIPGERSTLTPCRSASASSAPV